MSFGSLSSFNPYGEMAGAACCPYGDLDAAAPPTSYGYGTTATQAAWYGHQSGVAGWGGPYGANIFQRIFKPRAWEAEQDGEEGTASLFLKGSREEREAKREAAKERRQAFREPGKARRATARKKRQAKRAKAQSARKASQYRVVRGDGGYVFKQDGTNCYTVLKAPRKARRGKRAGERVCKGDRYWSAIHGEVLADHGPFSPGATASDWAKLAKVGGGIGLDLVRIFKGGGDADEPDLDVGPPGAGMVAPGGFPKTALFIGAGVVGLLLLVSLMKKR